MGRFRSQIPKVRMSAVGKWLTLSVLFAILSTAVIINPVSAQPENPNAPVDITYTASYYGGLYSNPGEAGNALGVQVYFSSSGSNTVLIGVFDRQTISYVATAVFSVPSGTHGWATSWTTKSVADAYDVLLYWFNGSYWELADRAIDWVQAGRELQCESGHCPFSPNEYTHPWVTPDGVDYKWVTTYFWYMNDPLFPSQQVGTDRLLRLRQYTNKDANNGKLQVEYRRQNVNNNPAEGWGAIYGVWDWGLCYDYTYGRYTNLPNSEYSDEELEGACPQSTGDEEAQVTTKNTESIYVQAHGDPTNFYATAQPYVYYVLYHFRRRPPQRGQNLTLQTEFEMLEGTWLGIDTLFDVYIPTRYSITF